MLVAEIVILSCVSFSDLQIFNDLYYYGWTVVSPGVTEVTYLVDLNIPINHQLETFNF